MTAPSREVPIDPARAAFLIIDVHCFAAQGAPRNDSADLIGICSRT
jgi:hypothetical protein